MTFRDDHDAALARADALEDEVERTRRERDALAAKVKELETPKAPVVKPRPATDSDPDANTRTSTIAGWVTAGVVGVLLVGFVIYRSCSHGSDIAVWQAKRDAREQASKRWVALVSVEECARRVALASSMTRSSLTSDLRELERRSYSVVHSIADTCAKDAAPLVGSLPQPASDAIRRWTDIQAELSAPTKALNDYFSHRDFVEDNYQGVQTLWKPVHAILDRQAVALERLSKDAFPVIRAELRALLAKHEAASGHDLTYWRGTFAVLQWECNDLAFVAGGVYAGREFDLVAASKAMRPKAVTFSETIPQAPIEVRRELRSSGFTSILRVASGADLGGSEPFFNLISSEWSLVGRGTGSTYVAALPPDPGPRPEEPFGD